MSGRARPALAIALALALAAGCAPRPTALVPVTGGTRRERYLEERLERERHAGLVQIAAAVFPRSVAVCDSCPPRRLPAFQASIALGWPDAFRGRVASLFGTALDLSASGDSIVAYVPPRDAVVELDAVRDSFGLPGPGPLLVRTLAAAWLPPEGAWGAADTVARWSEPGIDSVVLAVAADGRPAWVRLARADGRGIEARYPRWQAVGGVPWPAEVDLRGTRDEFLVVVRLDRVRFAPRSDAARALHVAVPEDAERLGVDRLRSLIRRAEGMP